MNNSLKKFMALLSAAAMLSGLGVPAAFAENAETELFTEITEAFPEAAEIPAELSDSSIASFDFNDAAVGTIVFLDSKDHGTVSDYIPGLNFQCGARSSGARANTNAAIVDGIGIDGSRALRINNADNADSGRGARFSVDSPMEYDTYKISMKVKPDASGSQNLGIGTLSSFGKTYTLISGEWNDVSVYVNKTGSGKAIEINGKVIERLDDSEAPAFWGNNAVNSGALYFDNITVEDATSIPDPDPTPTPIPATIGFTNSFDDYQVETLISMNATSGNAAYTGISGLELYVSSRSDPVADNCWRIVKDGAKSGNALELNTAGNANQNRSARVKLIDPKGVTSADTYKVTFDVKPASTQDLYVSDSTGTHGGTALGLKADWQKISIYMFGGMRIVMVDDRLGDVGSASTLPVLWGKNENNSGKITFDNYEISEATEEEIIEAKAKAVQITDSEKTIYEENGIYKVIGNAQLPVLSCGSSVSWTVKEKTAEGLADTADLTVKGGKLNVVNKDSSKKYVLTATVTEGNIVKTKEFELQCVPAQEMLSAAAEQIDITNGSKVESRGNDEYTVRGDFEVPSKAGQATVTWELKNPEDSKYVSIDGTTVKVTFTEPVTVPILAVLSYGGETYTKEYKLVLSNQFNNIKSEVDTAMAEAVIYPAGDNGKDIDLITLSETERTLITTDIAYKTAITSNITSKYTVSADGAEYISADGVISVKDKSAHNAELIRTVEYIANGTVLYTAQKTYPISVQFDSEAVEAAAKVKAEAYAEKKAAQAVEENDKITDSAKDAVKEAAFNAAMNILCDRYKVRFDAVYEDNFKNVPSSADDDFTLPTEGYFGSTITWGSSNTAIKITGEKAKVTQPSKDTDVKLTATFTSGAATNAKAYTATVSVEGTGKSSGSSGGSSGGGNSYRGSLGTSMYTNPTTATPAPVPNQPEVPKGEFTDLGSVAWAETAINSLAKQGIVSGRDAVTFAPNDDITRAEFAKILTGAFELELGAAADLTDVAEGEWYTPYVGACYAAGIITGYDDGSFKPNNRVTRQEMAVMVMRAAQYKGMTIEKPYEKVDFTDADEIASYAADAVDTLQQAGIINGMADGSFAPTATATRAQAAKILYTFCQE